MSFTRIYIVLIPVSVFRKFFTLQITCDKCFFPIFQSDWVVWPRLKQTGNRTLQSLDKSPSFAREDVPQPNLLKNFPSLSSDEGKQIVLLPDRASLIKNNSSLLLLLLSLIFFFCSCSCRFESTWLIDEKRCLSMCRFRLFQDFFLLFIYFFFQIFSISIQSSVDGLVNSFNTFSFGTRILKFYFAFILHQLDLWKDFLFY